MTKIATLAFLALSLASPQRREPSQADWDWLNEHRWAVIDAVMPIANTSAAVVFRSYRDLYQDVEERYFRVVYDPRQRTYAAVVVRPEGKSLQQQMLDRRLADPTTSVAAIHKQLRFQQTELSEEQCPPLRRHMTALEKLSLQTPSTDLIVLHPVVYQIVVSAGGGTLDATFVDDENSLVRWAVMTWRDLDGCAVRRSR